MALCAQAGIVETLASHLFSRGWSGGQVPRLDKVGGVSMPFCHSLPSEVLVLLSGETPANWTPVPIRPSSYLVKIGLLGPWLGYCMAALCPRLWFPSPLPH